MPTHRFITAEVAKLGGVVEGDPLRAERYRAYSYDRRRYVAWSLIDTGQEPEAEVIKDLAYGAAAHGGAEPFGETPWRNVAGGIREFVRFAATKMFDNDGSTYYTFRSGPQACSGCGARATTSRLLNDDTFVPACSTCVVGESRLALVPGSDTYVPGGVDPSEPGAPGNDDRRFDVPLRSPEKVRSLTAADLGLPEPAGVIGADTFARRMALRDATEPNTADIEQTLEDLIREPLSVPNPSGTTDAIVAFLHERAMVPEDVDPGDEVRLWAAGRLRADGTLNPATGRVREVRPLGRRFAGSTEYAGRRIELSGDFGTLDELEAALQITGVLVFGTHAEPVTTKGVQR